MKPHFPTPLAANSTAFRNLLLLAGIAAAVLPAFADGQEGAKTHTLFMGADISVGKDKTLYPVKDVVGSSWVVDVNGQDQTISAKDGPLNIKVSPSLKLTEVAAAVDNLKSERGYSFDNDPLTRQTRALSRAASLNAGYQATVNQANAAAVHAEAMVTATVNTSGVQGQNLIKAGYVANGPQTPTNNMPASYQQAANQAANGVGEGLELSGDRGLASGFDAMDVSFMISSERPLNHPYVVTIARFHPKEGPAGTVQNLVYAKALDPIDAHPTTVHFLEDGFPVGFEPTDFQMHFYNAGAEVATNVSAKRVQLTRDEAFEYVKMEYVAAHKGETLSAEALMGKLPPDLPGVLALGKYRDTFYVAVTKDGLSGGVFQDARCKAPLEDPYLQSLVKALRFKPALAKGRPVEGVASLNLRMLKI